MLFQRYRRLIFLEINKTPNDIKNEIIQRRSELTKKVKSEATRYDNPELLIDCSLLVSMNDDGETRLIQRIGCIFQSKIIGSDMKHFDWFGFANAWSYCHWFLYKYDNEFSCECEYLILNKGSFSKQNPYLLSGVSREFDVCTCDE